MWTAPRTWVTGEIVTAAAVNVHLRDNLLAVTRPYDKAASGIDVVSSTTETNLYLKTITGGDMGTDRMLRLTMLGDILFNDGASGTTLRIKFGGTTLWEDTIASSASATRRPYALQLFLGNQGSASVQFLAGTWNFGGVGATTGLGDVNFTDAGQPNAFSSGGTAALNTAVNQDLVVSAQHSANSANLSIRRFYAILELLQ